MADEEDDDQEQDETPEPPQRLFTLTEAERTRRELEPFLVEAMDSRKKLSGLENELSAVSARIMMMGGVIVPYEKLAAVINKQDVYLCWKLSEDRIRFYHRQDEGFSSRKPLDPRDLGPGDTIQ